MTLNQTMFSKAPSQPEKKSDRFTVNFQKKNKKKLTLELHKIIFGCPIFFYCCLNFLCL